MPLPAEPRRLGFRVDPDMGELARSLRASRRLYRALRPEALANLLYVAKEVRRITGRGTLQVTSTVRDLPYRRLLTGVNAEATRGFSLHTAGVAVDVTRGGSRGREAALRAVLERLRALGVADWVEEPTALHSTVGPEGRASCRGSARSRRRPAEVLRSPAGDTERARPPQRAAPRHPSER